ncbi:flagellar hook-basal body protein [Paenisporosarcina quisquiliarum]|uniref:Flagellar hook-basal body protein n=1 Tax=Paenisporosarcina quisquiliarum TaxID=365346 RepID=A0A9X3LF62_9BACL|nr:flagellar hook-basal body protein [Paenisporosarcina quisquiliarum]MCZ8536918.1 flagellar hook-basal body protein [Paenisporosarcina quisquiliarum]
MSIQMNSATTSMRELQKKIDIIANNISNVNTNGYKRQEANFSDALYQSIEKQAGPQNEIGRITPNGLRIGSGAIITQTSIRTEQGSIKKTDRPLDFMIQGNAGYFRVASEGTTFYTRDGSFQVQPVLNSNQVNLVTSSGDSVLDRNNRPIAFDGDYNNIKVTENGTLEVTYRDSSKQPTQIQLSIAQINRPNLLEKIGANRFQLPGTEAEQVANGTLQIGNNDGSIRITQGALEMSNVDLTDEMTELISTQRLLQSQGRAISFADDMMGLVNTMKS